MKRKLLYFILISAVVILLTGCGGVVVNYGVDDQNNPYEWIAVDKISFNLSTPVVALMGLAPVKDEMGDKLIQFSEISNNYVTSNVREYFRTTFYNNTFSDFENKILLTSLQVHGEGLSDNVAAPCIDDIAAYGFTSQITANDFWMSDGEARYDSSEAGICLDSSTQAAAFDSEHKLIPMCYLDSQKIAMFLAAGEDVNVGSLFVLTYVPSRTKIILIDESIQSFSYPDPIIYVDEGSSLILENINKQQNDCFIRCVVNYTKEIDELDSLRYGIMQYNETEKKAEIDISSLSADTYKFTFWFEDDLGTDDNTNICGESLTLEVVIAPEPEIALSGASNIGIDTATVSMSVTNRDKVDLTETGLEVSPNSDFSSGSTGGMALSVAGTDLTYKAAPLLKNTKYYYRAYAVDASGKYYSETKSFTTYNDKYTIAVSSGAGGSISPGSLEVSFGQSKSFTILPDSGYKLSQVLVDGGYAGAVESYTFADVRANHTISATFAEINAETTTSSAGTGATPSPTPSATPSSVGGGAPAAPGRTAQTITFPNLPSLSKAPQTTPEIPAPETSGAPSASPAGNTGVHTSQASVESLTNNGGNVFLGIRAGEAVSVEIGGLTFEVIDGIAQAEIPYGWVENGSLDITLKYSDGTSAVSTIALPTETPKGVPNWLLIMIAALAGAVVIIMLLYRHAINKKRYYIKPQ